jgi:hypothetical protein
VLGSTDHVVDFYDFTESQTEILFVNGRGPIAIVMIGSNQLFMNSNRSIATVRTPCIPAHFEIVKCTEYNNRFNGITFQRLLRNALGNIATRLPEIGHAIDSRPITKNDVTRTEFTLYSSLLPVNIQLKLDRLGFLPPRELVQTTLANTATYNVYRGLSRRLEAGATQCVN